ncbi:MAG: hypothetical protein PVI78_02740 [Anaerolineales bacterium]|jgi:hypothetical protein
MPQDWFNPLVSFLLRSPLHTIMSGNTMLITYTGRKSGVEYTLPINYQRRGYCLTAISNRSRVWWRNFRGGADVTLFLRRQHRKAYAEVIEDQTSVARGLTSYLSQAPQLARYFCIEQDEDGKPNSEALTKAASERVLIEIRLQDSWG